MALRTRCKRRLHSHFWIKACYSKLCILQGVDIFSKDFHFILIHHALHWSLVVVCSPGTDAACILHLDSLECEYLHRCQCWAGACRQLLVQSIQNVICCVFSVMPLGTAWGYVLSMLLSGSTSLLRENVLCPVGSCHDVNALAPILRAYLSHEWHRHLEEPNKLSTALTWSEAHPLRSYVFSK